MKSIQLVAGILAVCIASGCSQDRWQVRDNSLPQRHHQLTSVAERGTASSNAQDAASKGKTIARPSDEQTPIVSLVSATNETSRETVATEPPMVPGNVDNSTDLQPVQSSMSLSDFESLALANNPSILELAATTQKASGYRHQVGLKANPTFGYQGTQLADRNTDQHVAFLEQEFVTGNKLALNRNVLNEAIRAQLQELEAQKLRVSTDIEVKFYEALAAQRRVHLIGDFQTVTTKGIEVSEARVDAGEGTKIDTLQATIQKNEVDLALQQAGIQFDAAWRGLVALTGIAQMEPTTLIGELPKQLEEKDWMFVTSTVVSSSPEYRAAQTRVAQARAALQRHGVQAIPNLTVQIAAGVDNSTNNGMMNVQIGAPVPVFNKNQGNISAAQAEFCRASMEVQRIHKSIEARLAEVSQDYDAALAAVTKYRDKILPNAAEALKLAEQVYEIGDTTFVQVLVARRTYFDSNLRFVEAQSQLAQANARINGYVLTGGLDAVPDNSGDDSLRGLTFSQE